MENFQACLHLLNQRTNENFVDRATIDFFRLIDLSAEPILHCVAVDFEAGI